MAWAYQAVGISSVGISVKGISGRHISSMDILGVGISHVGMSGVETIRHGQIKCEHIRQWRYLCKNMSRRHIRCGIPAQSWRSKLQLLAREALGREGDLVVHGKPLLGLVFSGVPPQELEKLSFWTEVPAL